MLSSFKSKWLALPGVVQGAVWMLLGGASFAGLSVTIRLATQDVPTLEVVFFRNFINLLIMLPWLMKIGWSALKTERFGMHVMRSTNGLISMFFWFTAVSILPLAEATSLGFTAPLFATLGAALILREDVRARRWIAMLIGFAGTLIILRPGLQVVSPGALAMLAGAVFVAVSMLCVKSLSRTESPNSMVLYMAILTTPVSAIPLLWVWEMPQGISWLWLFGVGLTGTCGHLCFNRAMAAADASAVLPYEYGRLIFVAIIAYFLFSEVPDIWTWVGSFVIFAAGVYIANREAAAAREARRTERAASETVMS
jgi:drug/metabolite transporter (DMT)-like permease